MIGVVSHGTSLDTRVGKKFLTRRTGAGLGSPGCRTMIGRGPVKILIALLLVLVAAAIDAQEDQFSLGLDRLPLTAVSDDGTEAVSGVPSLGPGLSLELEDASVSQGLVYRSAITPTSAQEFRLALWDSPMGRLYYVRAEQESMLGRAGLVAGNRMVGLGMATAAIGDGDPGGLQLMMRHRWSELTLSDKVRAGVEASFLAALLYYMAEAAN